jgi:hypothetical protein
LFVLYWLWLLWLLLTLFFFLFFKWTWEKMAGTKWHNLPDSCICMFVPCVNVIVFLSFAFLPFFFLNFFLLYWLTCFSFLTMFIT